jgi:cell division protein ZapA
MGQVTLTLNGRSYRIGCENGEEARLTELGRHLREKLDGVITEFGQVGESRLLVLTALLITDELFEARAERDMAASTAAAAALRAIAEHSRGEGAATSAAFADEVDAGTDQTHAEDEPGLASLMSAGRKVAS